MLVVVHLLLVVELSFTLDRWMQLARQPRSPPPPLAGLDMYHDADTQLTWIAPVSQHNIRCTAFVIIFGGFITDNYKYCII